MNRETGRPRMTTDPNPEFFYGTRGRKNGMPHEQFVYSDIAVGMRNGLSALQIMNQYPRLAMSHQQVEYVMKKVVRDGEVPLS